VRDDPPPPSPKRTTLINGGGGLVRDLRAKIQKQNAPKIRTAVPKIRRVNTGRRHYGSREGDILPIRATFRPFPMTRRAGQTLSSHANSEPKNVRAQCIYLLIYFFFVLGRHAIVMRGWYDEIFIVFWPRF
jgi:hypothetical protein